LCKSQKENNGISRAGIEADHVQGRPADPFRQRDKFNEIINGVRYGINSARVVMPMQASTTSVPIDDEASGKCHGRPWHCDRHSDVSRRCGKDPDGFPDVEPAADGTQRLVVDRMEEKRREMSPGIQIVARLVGMELFLPQN